MNVVGPSGDEYLWVVRESCALRLDDSRLYKKQNYLKPQVVLLAFSFKKKDFELSIL